MTNFTPLEADPALLADGIAQAEESYVQSQKKDAEQLLGACYLNGLELYGAHLEDIKQKIDEAGGIKRVYTAERDGMNYIKCKDKSLVYASSVLITPAVALALPEQPQPRVPHFQPTQEGYVQLSVGGQKGIGLSAVEKAYEIDRIRTFGQDTLTDMLEGKYPPQQVAVREAVVTTSHQTEVVAVSGMIYQVQGRVWGSKLREEFAPDPVKNPDAYAVWRAQEPIPKLDLVFSASPKPVHGTHSVVSGPEFDCYTSPRDYYNDADMIPLQIEGAEKMIRFRGLLDMLWQERFGTNMPMPDSLTAANPTELPKELTA